MKFSFASNLLICAASFSLGVAEATPTRYADSRYSEDDFLPVQSSALSPGPVQRRALKADGLPAFFLIGDDALSRSWLKRRIVSLTTLNAVGLVVNVQSKKALDELRQIAPTLTLTAVSADDLAQRLSLKHYPVLITADRVEQ